MIDVPDPNAVAAELEALALGLPGHIRLAIATHRDVLGGPPGAGRVVELDERQLAFTPDEAVELLAGSDVQVIESLGQLSEGWAVALLAASAAAARGERNVAQWLRGPGVDRLFTTWFDRLSAPEAAFLLDTAMLDTLEVGACNAARDATDSAALLAGLVRKHAYLTEAGSETTAEDRTWRRHPLLTAFLRRRTEHDAAFLPHHARAADWFAGQGRTREAMRHLIAAGRTPEAADYLRRHESGLFAEGRGAEALDWYDRLPSEAHGTIALRMLRLGWGHALAGELEEAETWRARLGALGPGTGDDVEAQLDREGEMHVLSAYVAGLRGDAAQMVADAERAVAAFDGATDRDSEQLAHVLLVKGLQWSGDRLRAARTLDLLADRPFPNDMIRESSLAALKARRLLDEGRIHAAFAVADRAVRWVERRGLNPLDFRQSHAVGERAAALLERGDLAEADELLRAVCDSNARHHRSGELVAALVSVARLRTVRGDAGAALRAVRDARACLTAAAPGSAMSVLIDLAETRLRLAMGDAPRAERLIRGLPAGEERTLLWSRLLIARRTDTGRTLISLEPTTPRLAAEQHLLLAAARRQRGTRMAEAHLLRAGDIAAESGQALLLTETTPEIRTLADDLARRHGHDGLSWLLSIARQEPVPAPASGPPLSPGELQLLSLLPGRDTVARIADRLGISENTVKTRLRRLYRKLGVGSRDEAIAAARSRGLV